MRNLHLNSLDQKDLPYDCKHIRKILKKDNITVLLVKNSVLLLSSGDDYFNRINKSSIIDFEWIQLQNVICMANGMGFECYNVETGTLIEVSIPHGYDNFAWNATQDRLILVNKSGLIRVATIDFHFGEFILISNNISEKENVTKNQTLNEDKGVPEVPCLVWNKDGDSFVVSSTNNEQAIFSVYSINCECLTKNEYMPGLCPVLAWRPDGCIIAMLQNSEHQNIILFENNGLYKSSLTLNKNIPVINFKWNDEGDILYVHQKDTHDIISLYVMTNNHWYLKQSLSFDKETVINNISWMESRQNHICLEIITSNNILIYTWHWGVDTTNWIEEDCSGLIAVIDHCMLNVTVVTDELRPPPEYTFSLNFKDSINFVKFSPSGKNMIVVLNDYSGDVFELKGNEFIRHPFCLHDCINIYNNVPLSLNNFVLTDNNIFYGVQNSPYLSVIIKFNLERKNYHTVGTTVYKSTNVINHLSLVNDKFIINTNSGVFSCESNETVFQMESISNGNISIQYKFNKIIIFSLTENEFYFNNDLIASNITSYMICHDYLLLATMDNKLHCYKLTLNGLRKLQNRNTSDVYTRYIPKDAVLIAAVVNTRAIILQLPRGDLEIIKPRIFSINLIQNLLSEKKYAQAFEVVRNDRINSNIIVDVNSDRFLSDIHEFVRSINDCELLNIFITGLQDYNITEELYGKCLEFEGNDTLNSGKLKIILGALIDTMKILNRELYMQSIITAYICLNTESGKEDALKELKWGISLEESGVKLPLSVDEVFHRIITLIPVEQLYKVTLSLQDFHLIQWIADKTQLDPLEYIPFLQELHGMETNYRSYKINNYLKRYESAFISLLECDNVEEELLQIINKASLYKFAIKQVHPDNQWYFTVMNTCASYLQNEKHFNEAGLIFKQIHSHEAALDNFINASNFRESLNVIHIMQRNGISSFETELTKLADNLIASGKIKDACYLYEHHLKHYELGIKLLINSKEWDEALNMIYRHQRLDIIVSDFKPSLLEYITELCEIFNKRRQQFEENKMRLRKLRQTKMNCLMSQNVENVPGETSNTTDNITSALRDADVESLMSVLTVTSRQTGVTNTSSTSSRRKKKLERKVMETRAGSVFENIGLMRQLHLTIAEVQGYAMIVRMVCLHLLDFTECYEDAFKLHTLYESFIDFINDSSKEIWPTEFINPPEPPTVWTIALRQNINNLEPQYRYPPAAVPSNWKLYIFST